MIHVLFVCLGNICRSPTAHGIFQQKVNQAGLNAHVHIDSCGTGAWHVGNAPDERSVEAARKKGYDLSQLRARKLSVDDYARFDYILAMDARNLADVMKLAPKDYTGKMTLFLDYDKGEELTEVPDPYYGGSQGFERVIQLVEAASDGLLEDIEQALAANA